MNKKEKKILFDNAKKNIHKYLLTKIDFEQNNINIATYIKYFHSYFEYRKLFTDLDMLDDFYDILNNGYLQFCNKTLTNSYKSILTIFKENNITENITDLHKINNCLKNNSYCIDNEDIEKLKKYISDIEHK